MADAAEDAAPGTAAPNALENEVLGGDVEGQHVVGIHLLDDELVLPTRPLEQIHEDLAHLALDGRDEILRVDGVHLDEDRAEAPARADEL